MVLVVLVAGIVASWAHPGSGIVVDDKGRVYFTDTGQGVWKIDEGGRVSAHEGQSYHWMTIDLRAQFAAGLPQFVPQFRQTSTAVPLTFGSAKTCSLQKPQG